MAFGDRPKAVSNVLKSENDVSVRDKSDLFVNPLEWSFPGTWRQSDLLGSANQS